MKENLLNILNKSIYVTSPGVIVNEVGDVKVFDSRDRKLYVRFNQESQEIAKREECSIEKLLTPEFSNSCLIHVKNVKIDPFNAKDLCEEQGIDVSLEDAPRIANHLMGPDGPRWPFDAIYNISQSSLKFESLYLPFIETQINLDTTVFQRYSHYLKPIREQIISYWGNRVSEEDVDEFAESHPEIWFKKWVDFFLDNDDEGYLPVRKVSEITSEFISDYSALFREELSRIYEGQKPEFFLESEIVKI